MISYSCRAEELPIVEGALAAHGFVLMAPGARVVGGWSSMLLAWQEARVLLRPDAGSAEVHVWGPDAAVAIRILRTLPIVFLQDGQPADLLL